MFNINQYFDNKVTSISFQGEQLPASIGVMSAGQYQFDTQQHETMQIISGTLHVQLPDQQQWKLYQSGQSFEIPAGTSFQVKCDTDIAYLCTYA